MHTDAPTNLHTPEQIEAETAEVMRVTKLLMTTTAAEPHARLISALFTTLGVLAETHACCRDTVSKVSMQMGLQLAAMPEPSASNTVH